MPSKNKKSFFAKLKGSKKREEKPKEVELQQEEEEKILEEEQPEEQKAVQEQREDEDDWLSEYEGQLTIDVYQTPDNIVIKSTIAGVKPEDLDVSINNDMVTIKGSRKKEENIKEEDYFYQECYWGSFSRSIILPVEVEADKAEADLKNGILTITLPKSRKAKAKKIQVKGL